MPRPVLALFPAILLLSAIAFPAAARAQDSDFNLDVHANGNVTAKDIGLPEYPGAAPYKDKDANSSSGDLGFLLNSFHFSLKAASFVTTDSQQQVLDYYRTPLSQHGEVIECNHGKPVGAVHVTKSGLTCGDSKSGHMTVNGDDGNHELRAGKPTQFWIVGVEKTDTGKTKFGLVALILPKEEKK